MGIHLILKQKSHNHPIYQEQKFKSAEEKEREELEKAKQRVVEGYTDLKHFLERKKKNKM